MNNTVYFDNSCVWYLIKKLRKKKLFHDKFRSVNLFFFHIHYCKSRSLDTFQPKQYAKPDHVKTHTSGIKVKDFKTMVFYSKEIKLHILDYSL